MDPVHQLTQGLLNHVPTTPAAVATTRADSFVASITVPDGTHVGTAARSTSIGALFNEGIAHLEGPLEEGTFTQTYRLQHENFYLWLYREPSLFGKKPLVPHGFFMPQGSDVTITIRTTRTADGWERHAEIETPGRPGNLGAWGPMPLKGTTAPLASTRVAKMIFVQQLGPDGRVRSEKTLTGITFANAHSGQARGPSWIERRGLEPTEVPYRGTTLYLVDVTDSVNEIWEREDARLRKAIALHKRETGETLPFRSAANRLAFLKYTLIHGRTLARGQHSDKVNRARQALNL